MGLWVETDGHWTLDKSSPPCVDGLLGHVPPGCRENCAGQDRVSGPRSQWCEIPYSHPWGQCGPPRQGRWGCCHQAQGPRIVPKERRCVTAPWARASASPCWAQPRGPSRPCSPQPALQPQPLRALWRLSWLLQARGACLQGAGTHPSPLVASLRRGSQGKKRRVMVLFVFQRPHVLIPPASLSHSRPQPACLGVPVSGGSGCADHPLPGWGRGGPGLPGSRGSLPRRRVEKGRSYRGRHTRDVALPSCEDPPGAESPAWPTPSPFLSRKSGSQALRGSLSPAFPAGFGAPGSRAASAFPTVRWQ